MTGLTAKTGTNQGAYLNSLAQRIKAAPHVADPEAARGRVAGWLADVQGTDVARDLQRLFEAYPLVNDLVTVLADGSPYLWQLASLEPDRLVRVLEADPDQLFPELLAQTAQAVASAGDMDDAMRLLRRMKAEAALLVALADIGDVWPVMQVTRAVTDIAEAGVSSAVRFLLADAAVRGKLQPADPDRPEEGAGYIVLAMGKMGAFELNYSSDIDLIVFFDPEAPALADGVEPGPLFIRITRALIKLMQERTGDGYVFRTDLRLRPDPGSTQVAISTPAALNYYESVGQNWERAAMIKARACAGDLAAGQGMLRSLSPFVWRKYLDFAAVADVHAMKRRMHAYRGHGEIAVEGHNVKLGRGGIREIEFFVQTQQLIAGGRHPELRGRETLSVLATLAEGGWVDTQARDDLTAAYCFLRTVEHRLQMVADEQTHTLPSERERLERFARFMGFENRDAFAAVFLGHLHKVQEQYVKLFETAPAFEAKQRGLSFPVEADDRETLDKLVEMGFQKPLEVSSTVRHWLAEDHRTLKSEFAREQLGELVPMLIEQLARAENPDAAVLTFDRFLDNLHAGGRLLSLLRQNTDMLSLLTTVLGTAPRLADTVAHFPQVMDAVVDPSFFGAMPEEQALAASLAAALEQARSHEDFLDRIRMFGQEHLFLIGIRILSGTLSAELAGEAFARLADVLMRSLHSDLTRQFAVNHGHIRGQQTAILALGKLGGREMTAASDLDLIVAYDFDDDHPESDGERSLYGSQYFARLTQRLISALTAQTNYGVLYQVDMRLRPSGRAGPLATKLDAFAQYQESEAWTWEHMALTRARVVSSSPEFAARIEEIIRAVLCRPRVAEVVASEVVDMRRAIAAEKDDNDRWNLKYAAGGLIDIEFIAQYLQLVHAAETPDILNTSTTKVLEKAWQLGLLATPDAEVLRPAVRLYHDLTQILRLCLPGEFDPKTAGPGLLDLVTRAADVPDFAALDAHIIETQAKVRESFVRILGGSP